MILLLTILSASLFTDHVLASLDHSQEDQPELFVGIDVAYYSLDEMYELIDEVSSYTNLFIIGTTAISYNETRLNQTCQYLYDLDMYFIIYNDNHRRLQVISDIAEKYGDHFLGVYFDDENGGKQLDIYDYRWVYEADNYADAANQFVQGLKWWLNRRYIRNEILTPPPSDFHLFTSDYALYWFDYKAGYDTVFAEFGWNYSRQLNVALCRGAATVQNKEWGVMITWTYNHPPYIESGTELYNDMVIAYENGAKYILVFDSNEGYTQGILQNEHLEALKQFWQYTKENPRTTTPTNKRVAFVLPKDYAYGFRGPNDKIWGLWEQDSLSLELSQKLGSLLEEYKTDLDIIYDDPQFDYTEKYSKIYFWNSTIVFSNISCEVSSSNITTGNSITVSGSINPAILANVTLQISTDNGTTWNNLTTLPSTSDGNYSYTWTPEATGSYELKASWEGEKSIIKATSTNVLVTVTKNIPSTISYSVSSSVITEGDSVYISGFIDPAVLGKIVTFTLKRPDGLTLKRTVTTDINGFFYDLFKPHGRGYWNVTATLNGDFTYAEEFTPEQSFKLTNPLQELLDLPPSTMLIIGNATAAITIIALIAWFITRPPTQLSNPQSTVKAYLLGFGSGMLEFIDGTLRFHLGKRHFRKRNNIIREIPMSDIKSMNRTGNELSLTWKGVMDIFVIEETELAGTIFERITQNSRERKRMFEDNEATNKKRNEPANLLSVAMETADSLFDIIRSLYGWVDWKHIEDFLKRSQENALILKDQKIGLIALDFTKLSLAVKERLPEEISKETYNLLRLLHDYFNGLATANESIKQVHPNYHDAKTTIRAYYLLNDIILGLMVGDKVEKEIDALAVMLEDLSKDTGLKINMKALKYTIVKMGAKQEKESAIEESRTVFRKQLEGFKKIE